MEAPSFRSRTWLPIWLLLVLASRVPLLGNGFGSDPDSWRNAVAAVRMHEVGRYLPSRNPGFPVFEGFITLLVPLGPVATNLLSAVAGVIAVALFLRLAGTLRIRNRFLLSALFAFSGPLWIHSTQTMDYAVGLAFLLGAYCALLGRRHVLGGILVALAAGCRITVGAALLPAVVMLLLQRTGPRVVGRFLVGFGATITVLFIPVWLSSISGPAPDRFLTHAARSHVTLATLAPTVREGVVFLFGKLGAPTLLAALVFAALAARGSHVSARTADENAGPPGFRDEYRGAVAFELGVTLIIGALYLMIPYETAYLIPMFPFTLLLAGRLLSRPLLALVLLLVLSDAFITPLMDQRRFAPGRLLAEINQRRTDVAASERLADRSPAVRTIFVVGRFGIQRLLLLRPSLERTEAAWAPFQKSGVALWSSDRRIGYAAQLEANEHGILAARGYQIESAAP